MRSLVTALAFSLILAAGSPAFAAAGKPQHQSPAKKNQAKKNKARARKFSKRAKQARQRSN